MLEEAFTYGRAMKPPTDEKLRPILPELLSALPSSRWEEAREHVFEYLAVIQQIYDRIARDPTHQALVNALTDSHGSGTLQESRPLTSSSPSTSS